MHDNDGDPRQPRATEGPHDPLGLHDAARWGEALKLTLASVSALALLLSIPELLRFDFPVTGLVVYAIGMVFVAMPLCLYHEYLLRGQGGRVLPPARREAALQPL